MGSLFVMESFTPRDVNSALGVAVTGKRFHEGCSTVQFWGRLPACVQSIMEVLELLSGL